MASNTISFVEKAKLVHNNKYNYGKTNYINQISKITVTCPTDGDFQISPYNHLSGWGCPACLTPIQTEKPTHENIKYQHSNN